ncbi:RINT1-like protein MAG2 [Quillaja saponaria]|uniref:RINT1-like protein MAG2 n=1 Tax=Quillaja saponaria TaxID=32244 RepID=A0AAD7QBF3_QUISA|nr:RINT1-like protein MAG2 [Quillaja saponaria]
MRFSQVYKMELSICQSSHGERSFGIPGRGIIDEEIGKLEEFRINWAEKISSVILRGSDSHCRDYIKNKRHWHEKHEEGWTVSKSLIGALDYLQGIDRLIFTGILMNNVKFNNGGVERLGCDLEVLYGLFGLWCLRPKSFFPKASEGIKLLKMCEKKFQDCLAGGERWLKENGIRQLSVAEAEKIVKVEYS